jgi:hypothetical protein
LSFFLGTGLFANPLPVLRLFVAARPHRCFCKQFVHLLTSVASPKVCVSDTARVAFVLFFSRRFCSWVFSRVFFSRTPAPAYVSCLVCLMFSDVCVFILHHFGVCLRTSSFGASALASLKRGGVGGFFSQALFFLGCFFRSEAAPPLTCVRPLAPIRYFLRVRRRERIAAGCLCRFASCASWSPPRMPKFWSCVPMTKFWACSTMTKIWSRDPMPKFGHCLHTRVASTVQFIQKHRSTHLFAFSCSPTLNSHRFRLVLLFFNSFFFSNNHVRVCPHAPPRALSHHYMTSTHRARLATQHHIPVRTGMERAIVEPARSKRLARAPACDYFAHTLTCTRTRTHTSISHEYNPPRMQNPNADKKGPCKRLHTHQRNSRHYIAMSSM